MSILKAPFYFASILISFPTASFDFGISIVNIPFLKVARI